LAAPIGNRFWEARGRHGRLPSFASPEQLWETATDYFAWCEENPLYEDKLVTFQGDAKHEPCAKMRAMTENGFCIFAGCSLSTWHLYCLKEDFSEVAGTIKQIIRDQKFSGAAADLLNANIIARDLGLADRTVSVFSGQIEATDISARDLVESKLDELAKRAKAATE
jgi:hypothetical protein